MFEQNPRLHFSLICANKVLSFLERKYSISISSKKILRNLPDKLLMLLYELQERWKDLLYNGFNQIMYHITDYYPDKFLKRYLACISEIKFLINAVCIILYQAN